MKKIFTLSTCSTSKRILEESGILGLRFEIQDIKKNPVSKEDLEYIRSLADSYNSLFSRRAQKYKALGLKNIDLSEEDIKQYILSDYTFLKRPIIIDGNNIFVGNSKKTQEKLNEYVKNKLDKNIGK